jgi:hypothetical protein
LPPRTRTNPILRICGLLRREYEWGGQAAFWGPIAGVSEQECDALAGDQVDDGLHVHPYLGDLVGNPRLEDRPDGAHAGVVDQDVHPQSAPGDLVQQARAYVGDVAADHLDAHRVAEFGGEVL